MKKNILLEEFNVKNYEELLNYMEEHPEDERVKQLLELFEMLEGETNDGEE